MDATLAPPAAAPRSHATSHVAVSRGPIAETPAPAPPANHGPSLMAMRGPEITTGLGEDFIGNFLASNGGPAPTGGGEGAPTGELAPSGHGTFESKHETFTAHVAKDGTVHLDDTPDVDMKPQCLFIGCKMAFDDAIMRAHGIDPYSSAKLKWLDQTRDERAAIGMANRKEMLAHADQFMQQNLDAMWAQITDATQRKRTLFMMWDEIAESGDDALVQAGAAARAYLVGFVRSHLPRGTAGAFTSDELAQLNAHRTSHQTFVPYE